MNRWCDGLGRYGGTKSYMLNGSSSQAWAQVDSLFSLSTANPRTGTHHLRLASTGVGAMRARRVFGAPLTEVFFGFAFYCTGLPDMESHGTTGGGLDGVEIASFRDQANAVQCRVLLGTDGALEVRNGLTVLGRSLPVIGAGAYQHIEIYAKASDTVGAIEIRVDEVTKLNLTGKDTVATANIEFSQVAFGTELATTASYPTMDYADFYVNDTTSDGSGCDTWLGDCKSAWRVLNADTAQADFALSAGSSGYALLDETPPNDSDYIDTASSTARSDFGFANGPGNESEILTARPGVRAWKDDAGTCEIAPSLQSNSVDATVSSQPITTAPAYYDSNVPVNPDTGVPWTPTELNAAFEIIERTS